MVVTHDGDEQIAIRVQNGDTEAFGVLVDRFEPKLLRYGKKFINRPEDIEDVVQDVFVNVYQNIQSFDSSMRFSPWIYRIAHNAFVNALRKHSRTSFNFDFDTFISHQVYEDPAESERELRDTKAILEKELQFLKPKYREILILHYFEEMPYKDIADILEVPIGTVSIRMKRAKEALKERIKQHL